MKTQAQIEADLLKPVQWPPTKLSIPALFVRAKEMLDVLLAHVKSSASLARMWKLRRPARREIMSMLVPIEKIVRTLLVAKAITHLLMTPQGRQLLRDTEKMQPPAPRRGPKAAPHMTSIPLPGWHTIARLWRDGDLIPGEPVAEPPPPPDPNDPANWACRFTVLSWKPAEPDEPRPPAIRRGPRICVLGGSDDWPIAHAPVKPAPAPELSRPDGDPGAYAVARRIEALARVLANPEPAIQRLARYIARLPKDVLLPLDPCYTLSLWWHHGRPEFYNVCDLVARAIGILNALIEPG